jgi:hypothetical protein
MPWVLRTNNVDTYLPEMAYNKFANISRIGYGDMVT